MSYILFRRFIQLSLPSTILNQSWKLNFDRTHYLVACVPDNLNRRYSPSAQWFPKACSDILLVHLFLIDHKGISKLSISTRVKLLIMPWRKLQ